VRTGAGVNRAPAVLVAAGLSLAAGILIEPWFGLVTAGLSAGILWKPFDPVTTLAVLAGAASFVDNEGGHMTRDLSMVTLVAVYALFPIALARARGRWRALGGPLVLWLAAFLAWTAVATLRGLLAGYEKKFIGLEVAALGTMTFTWLAAGLRPTARELRPALVVILVAGLGHVVLGIVSYAVNHMRTGGIWYTPLPGMLAVLSLCFGVRARTLPARVGWALLLGLFLLHQTISFSRGYWLGLLVAMPATAFLYARTGPRSLERWRRVGALAAVAGGVLLLTTVVTAVLMGWSDLPALLGTRFGSSFTTGNGSSVSASNLARMIEHAASFRLIQQNPLFGYGMGLELHIRDPLRGLVSKQAYVHESYLWLWLKQGLIGVVLLLAVLFQAVRTALTGAAATDDERSAWCLTAAGVTIYFGVLNLTSFHLAQVNATMFQSLLWGFALATTRPVQLKLVWRAQPAPAAGRAAPIRP